MAVTISRQRKPYREAEQTHEYKYKYKHSISMSMSLSINMNSPVEKRSKRAAAYSTADQRAAEHASWKGGQAKRGCCSKGGAHVADYPTALYV